ncbi:MAG: hypothetical protein GY769_09905, partial [bacterium]|nr:hypothetical protein [bacterium]
GGSTATVRVTVTCVNDAPVAADDAASVDENNSVVVSVLANDTDTDNANPAELTVSVSQAATASGSVSTDGTTVTYTPTQNFSGEDRFGYQVCDLEPLCDDGEVVVTVNDLGDPPVATVGITAVTSGDVDIQITLSGTDPNEDTLTFTIISGPSAGTIDSIVPASDPADPLAEVVATYNPTGAGDVEDSFVFQVDDGNGGTDTAEVLINPGAESEPPPPLGEVIANDLLCNPQDPDDCAVEALQGQTKITIVLSAAAPCDPTGAINPAEPCDGEGNDVPLTFSLSSNTTSQGGTLSNLVQGSEVPQRSATVDYLAPNADFVGKDDFSFIVTGDVDGSGSIDQPEETDTGVVEINVQAFTPPEPVEAFNQFVTAEEETPVTVDLSIDPPGGCDPEIFDCRGATAFAGAPAAFGTKAPSAAGSGSGNGVSDRGGSSSVLTDSSTPTFALGVGAGWRDFTWNGTIPVFATDDPSGDAQYEITLTGPGCVSVTDDFDNGDQFRIYDSSNVIGETTAVARIDPGTALGPDLAFADPAFSSGTFALAAGSYSIEVEAIGASFSGGRGYIRVDAEGSAQCEASPAPNLTIVEFSAPASIAQSNFFDSSSGWYAFGDSIRVVVANTGNVASSGGFVGLYISGDSAVTTTDDLLIGGRESLPALAPGQSAQIQLVGVNGIPELAPTGNVFLGAVVDDQFTIAEIVETDNTASQALLYQSNPAFTITSLPTGGTLTQKVLTQPGNVIVDEPITTVPTTLSATAISQVTYTPSQATVSDGFNFEVSDGLSVATASVAINVVVFIPVGTCEDNAAACEDGRNGGGTPFSAPAPIGGLPKGAAFTVSVSGSGDVSSNRPYVDGKRYLGLVCSTDSDCSANFVDGSTVVLFARPTGSGSEFVEWGGDCQGTDPVTVVQARSETFCTATFRETKD